ncbi:ATP-binding protein [Sphingomonas sp. MMS24-J13]|uniref:ATP-binding protein n=1 Tax=Sphingomonas sp. MMS24-J13 TaxID=3238686 RepID=UPI00384F110A
MCRTSIAVTKISPVARQSIHDLRNLFGIIASASNLLGDDPSDERRAQLLDAIAGAALRGGHLTTQLLAATGGIEQLFDINDHLRSLESMLRAIGGRDIVIRLDLAARPIAMKLDPDAIEAAVLELVTNAKAACAPGDTVTIRTRFVRHRLWLFVVDNGHGMDSAALRDCLAAKSPAAHGTGIGRIRRFSQDAAGRFHISSRPGHGTVVCLKLPTALTLVADEAGAASRRCLSPRKEMPREERQSIAA